MENIINSPTIVAGVKGGEIIEIEYYLKVIDKDDKFLQFEFGDTTSVTLNGADLKDKLVNLNTFANSYTAPEDSIRNENAFLKKELDEKSKNLQEEIIKLQKSISDLENANKEANAAKDTELESLKTSNADLIKQINEINTEKEQQIQDLKNLEKVLEEKTGNETMIQELNDKIMQLNNELEQSAAKLKDNENKQTEQKLAYEGSQIEADANLKKIQSELEKQMSELVKSNAELLKEKTTLSDENTTLLNEKTTLSNEKDTLSNENKELKAANELLKNNQVTPQTLNVPPSTEITLSSKEMENIKPRLNDASKKIVDAYNLFNDYKDTENVEYSKYAGGENQRHVQSSSNEFEFLPQFGGNALFAPNESNDTQIKTEMHKFLSLLFFMSNKIIRTPIVLLYISSAKSDGIRDYIETKIKSSRGELSNTILDFYDKFGDTFVNVKITGYEKLDLKTETGTKNEILENKYIQKIFEKLSNDKKPGKIRIDILSYNLMMFFKDFKGTEIRSNIQNNSVLNFLFTIVVTLAENLSIKMNHMIESIKITDTEIKSHYNGKSVIYFISHLLTDLLTEYQIKNSKLLTYIKFRVDDSTKPGEINPRFRIIDPESIIDSKSINESVLKDFEYKEVNVDRIKLKEELDYRHKRLEIQYNDNITNDLYKPKSDNDKLNDKIIDSNFGIGPKSNQKIINQDVKQTKNRNKSNNIGQVPSQDNFSDSDKYYYGGGSAFSEEYVTDSEIDQIIMRNVPDSEQEENELTPENYVQRSLGGAGETYNFHSSIGPVNGVFTGEYTNKDIVENKTFQDDFFAELTKPGGNLVVNGIGQSGSGKTSTLIELKIRDNQGNVTKDPGILKLLSNKLVNEQLTEKNNKTFTHCTFKITELYHDPKKVEDINTKYAGISKLNVIFNDGNFVIEKTNESDPPNPSLNSTNMFEQIMYFMDNERMTFGTPNNPESSRSHVVITITFHWSYTPTETTPSKTTTSSLTICDLAGVENMFDCSEPFPFLSYQKDTDDIKMINRNKSRRFNREFIISKVAELNPTNSVNDDNDILEKIKKGLLVTDRDRKCMIGNTTFSIVLKQNITNKNIGIRNQHECTVEINPKNNKYEKVIENITKAESRVMNNWDLNVFTELNSLIAYLKTDPIPTIENDKDIKQFFMEYAIETAIQREYNSFDAGESIRKEFHDIMNKFCDERAKEGTFINDTLYQLKEDIGWMMAQNGITYSPFIGNCVQVQCNPYVQKCFGDDPYELKGSTRTDGKRDIFNTICSNTENEIIDNSTPPKNLKFCVFCVINLSKNANNPPPVPYVNISKLMKELELFESSEKIDYGFLDLLKPSERIRNEKDAESDSVSSLDSETDSVSSGESENAVSTSSTSKPVDFVYTSNVVEKKERMITELQNVLKKRSFNGLNDQLKNALTEKIEKAIQDIPKSTKVVGMVKEIIEMINKSNATTLMGTLDFVDLTAKMGRGLNPCILTKSDMNDKYGLSEPPQVEKPVPMVNELLKLYNNNNELLIKQKSEYQKNVDSVNTIFNVKKIYEELQKYVNNNFNVLEALRILDYFDITISSNLGPEIITNIYGPYNLGLDASKVVRINDYYKVDDNDKSKVYTLNYPTTPSFKFLNISLNKMYNILIESIHNKNPITIKYAISSKVTITGININIKKNIDKNEIISKLNNNYIENIQKYVTQCLFKRLYQKKLNNGKIQTNIIVDLYTLTFNDSFKKDNNFRYFITTYDSDNSMIDNILNNHITLLSNDCKIVYDLKNDKYYPNELLYNVIKNIKYPIEIVTNFKKTTTVNLEIYYPESLRIKGGNKNKTLRRYKKLDLIRNCE